MVKTRKKKKNPNNYVDNKKFYEIIVEYKKKLRLFQEGVGKEPQIPDYAGDCILKIAQNLVLLPQFNRYSYKEEMISDGIENSIKYFNNFDENKYTNPHAYFTTICFQANVNRIKREQKNRYGIYKSFEREMIFSENGERLLQETAGLKTEALYDNILEFIENYERKEKERKIKQKEKLREKQEANSGLYKSE